VASTTASAAEAQVERRRPEQLARADTIRRGANGVIHTLETRIRAERRPVLRLLAGQSGLIYGTAPFVAIAPESPMLEQIVQKFRGIVLFFVVFTLSAVFMLQFGGPQAKGCSSGGAAAAAKVYGRSITRNEVQSAYLLSGGENYPDEMAKQYKLREMVMYGLIERNLLARQARTLGYQVSEDEVLQKMAEDGVVHLSMSVDAGPYLPPSGPQRFSFEDSKGKFNKDNLRNFIQYRLRRSVGEFTRDQIEEALAQRMRDAVTASVSVSPGELWDAYVREQESAKLKYVRFSTAYYGQQLQQSESELNAFMTQHQKEVDAEYEKQKARYTGLEKQVRARHILIKVAESASDEQKQAARAKIDALLARARKGEDFASLARANSQDEGSAKKGGDLGFNPKGRMVKPFDDAQFALKPGEISDVVESTFGLHVIKVEAIREGDVPVAEAKHELAEKLFRDGRSAELAKRAANELLQKAQAGQTLEDAVAGVTGTPARAAGDEAPDSAADPLAPQVRETRAFGRTDTAIAGPFDSTPLVKAAYELTEQQPLPSAPMQLGDDWFVYRLESKVLANKAAFTAEEQARIENGLLRRKRTEMLKAYVRGLRDQAIASKDIFVDADLINNEKPLAPEPEPEG
jgi:peptidyl-prolyl cis-trans isomerase D